MAGAGDGGAGDFDPCECVWSHELATRRLINMIRQNQDYCTENECYTETDASDPSGSTAMFFIGFWFLMAVILFFLRPKTSVPAAKGRDGSGPSYDPPAPATN
ncbi:unnamed protein product [Allacma fusca]|uniref:Small integral membrane protein 14 n=1 Tax=Allacma fusca TaxID=39272 RepID=A0A8J2K7A6_9HEXA|nr:unnamed protein product [Allacma fusca]